MHLGAIKIIRICYSKHKHALTEKPSLDDKTLAKALILRRKIHFYVAYKNTIAAFLSAKLLKYSFTLSDT